MTSPPNGSSFFSRFSDLGAFGSQLTQPEPTTQPQEEAPLYPSLFGSSFGGALGAFGSSQPDLQDDALAMSAVGQPIESGIRDVVAAVEERMGEPVVFDEDEGVVVLEKKVEITVEEDASPLGDDPSFSSSPSFGPRDPSLELGDEPPSDARLQLSQDLLDQVRAEDQPIEITTTQHIDIITSADSDAWNAPVDSAVEVPGLSVISGKDREGEIFDETPMEDVSAATGIDLSFEARVTHPSPGPGELFGTPAREAGANELQQQTPEPTESTPPLPKTAPAKRLKRASVAPSSAAKHRRRSAADMLLDAAGSLGKEKLSRRPRVSTIAPVPVAARTPSIVKKKFPAVTPAKSAVKTKSSVTPGRVGRPRKSETALANTPKAKPGPRRATIAPKATTPKSTPKPKTATPKGAVPATEPRPRGRPSRASLSAAAATPRVAALRGVPATEPRGRGRPAGVSTPTTPNSTPKRRGRPPKNPEASPIVKTATPKQAQTPVKAEATPAKRVGRPPRAATPTVTATATRGKRTAAVKPPVDTADAAPKRRGRPPKSAVSEPVKTTRGKAVGKPTSVDAPAPKRGRAAKVVDTPAEEPPKKRGRAAKKAETVVEPSKKRGRAAKTTTEEAPAPAAPKRGRAAKVTEPPAAPASKKRGRAAKIETEAAPEPKKRKIGRPATKKEEPAPAPKPRGRPAAAKVEEKPAPKPRGRAKATTAVSPVTETAKRAGRKASGKGENAPAAKKAAAATKVQSGRVTKAKAAPAKTAARTTGRALRSRD